MKLRSPTSSDIGSEPAKENLSSRSRSSSSAKSKSKGNKLLSVNKISRAKVIPTSAEVNNMTLSELDRFIATENLSSSSSSGSSSSSSAKSKSKGNKLLSVIENLPRSSETDKMKMTSNELNLLPAKENLSSSSSFQKQKRNRNNFSALKSHPVILSSSVKAHPVILSSSVKAHPLSHVTASTHTFSQTPISLLPSKAEKSKIASKESHQPQIRSATIERQPGLLSKSLQQKKKNASAPKVLDAKENFMIQVKTLKGANLSFVLDKYPKKNKDPHIGSLSTTFWKDLDGNKYIGKTISNVKKDANKNDNNVFVNDTPVFEALNARIIESLRPKFNAMRYIGVTYDFPLTSSKTMCTLFFSYEGKKIDIDQFMNPKPTQETFQNLLKFCIEYLEFGQKYGFQHTDLHLGNIVQNDQHEFGIIDYGRVVFHNLPAKTRNQIPTFISHMNKDLQHHRIDVSNSADDIYRLNDFNVDKNKCLTQQHNLEKGLYALMDLCSFILSLYLRIYIENVEVQKYGPMKIYQDGIGNFLFSSITTIEFTKIKNQSIELFLKISEPFFDFLELHMFLYDILHNKNMKSNIYSVGLLGMHNGGFQFMDEAISIWCNSQINLKNNPDYSMVVQNTINNLKVLT